MLIVDEDKNVSGPYVSGILANWEGWTSFEIICDDAGIRIIAEKLQKERI